MSHHYLRFDDVHYRYPNGYEALCGVSFRITHGEKVALVGANGAGKSTLLLHTNGLLMPSQGGVVLGGIALTRKTLPLVRQSVGLVFQDSDNQLFMPTVEEDVAFGPSNMRLEPEEIRRRVTEALDAVGALNLRGESPFRLSGGQKKRVAIATVLAMEPSVLVMDEPTSNLDPRARRQIIDLIRRFSHTTLIATHDMEMVLDLCDRTIVMKEGRIVADGSTRHVFGDLALLEECGLEQPCELRMKRALKKEYAPDGQSRRISGRTDRPRSGSTSRPTTAVTNAPASSTPIVTQSTSEAPPHLSSIGMKTTPATAPSLPKAAASPAPAPRSATE